jgi:hypothetical protein
MIQTRRICFFDAISACSGAKSASIIINKAKAAAKKDKRVLGGPDLLPFATVSLVTPSP